MGQSIATCFLSATATNAARSATSVLPKPTSPQIRRSIGLPEVMSPTTARDRRRLVGRFLEAEAVRERFQVVLLDAEGVALPRGALGVELEQFGGGVAHLLRGARARLVPLAAAQLVQRRFLGLRARVARDHLELRHRHVELVAAVVFEQQEFGHAFAEVEVDQAAVAADAVLHVHHRVADLEFGEVAQHALDRALRLGAAALAPHRAGVELGLGDHRPALGGDAEAVGERGDGDLKMFRFSHGIPGNLRRAEAQDHIPRNTTASFPAARAIRR